MVQQRIREIATLTAQAHLCEADVDITEVYPCTVNTPIEASHVKRIATETLGDEFFSTEGVPMTASEDFSFFTEEKPGAFFFIGTGKPD